MLVITLFWIQGSAGATPASQTIFMILLTLLLIPTLLALLIFLFGNYRVTKEEFLGQLAAQVLIIGLAYACMLWSETHDLEVWNGRVSAKTRETVHCRHSYQCNCVTVSCGKDCQTTICQTCYHHSYDVDWYLSTTNSERIDIYTIDWQGVNEPPRWTRAKKGDTTSLTHSYTNYIKAASNSLFRRVGLVEKYQDQLPNYPQNIYDYHYLDRMVLIGTSLPDLREWNSDLRELNADIGRKKESNIVIVITKNKPDEYFYALEQHWIGGKKNDIIVVIDVNDAGKINWTETMAWTDSHIFKVNMRDDLLAVGNLNRKEILAVIQTVTLKNYVRKPMKDFEYLKQSITPTKGQYIGLTIFGLLLSLGISWFVYKNDVITEKGR